jgi:NADH-quinone oxidoreductase subunit J
MAAALILIYAGAILVTYVFVIMLAAEASAPGAGARGFLEHDVVARDPVIAAAVGFALMGVLLFVVFDKASGLQPAASGQSETSIVQGSTQELGVFLFQRHLVNVELAGLILTVSMIGAIVIARRKVVGDTGPVTSETLVAPMTPINDDPHSIPVVGTRNPRQKEYPET